MYCFCHSFVSSSVALQAISVRSIMDIAFTQDLRNIVLHCKVPLIIRNVLNWDILEWSLEQWSQTLSSEDLEFRSGKYMYTMEPQWERTTKRVTKKFTELTSIDVRQNKEWLYFDYKYLNSYLRNKVELHNSISWEKFGFPEYNAEDSTLWIGSQGAHTPCHKDTYGCNLVAQIYGRKRWLLFSPNENLYATRVPYEESSIYSKLNFFSPGDIEVFKGINQAKSVVLHPGEVLFVPNGCWHYVENLEMAISVNIWIPLSSDRKHQLKESLIQMFVSQVIKDVDQSKRKDILNPNMEELCLEKQNLTKSLEIIKVCTQNCLSSEEIDCNVNLEELFTKHATNLYKIPDLSKSDFYSLLQNQVDRFKHSEDLGRIEDILDDKLRKIIDVFTNEDVIDLVVTKLLDDKN